MRWIMHVPPAPTGLALNTQASNLVSRRLYESLGFRPTGQALSVMVYPVLLAE